MYKSSILSKTAINQIKQRQKRISEESKRGTDKIVKIGGKNCKPDSRLIGLSLDFR
jgi:hypothetical protein